MYPIVAQRAAQVIATASPGVLGRALGFASKATGVVMSKGQDMIDWIKRSPAAASLIVASLIEAGVSVSELFSDEDIAQVKSDPDGGPLAALIESARTKVRGVLDGQADVALNMGDQGDLIVMKDMIGYLFETYRTAPAIRRAHMYHRMFIETSTESLDKGIALFGR